MNNLIQLLTQLAPLATGFVPQAGEAEQIIKTLGILLAHISAQSGKTTAEILDETDAILDANEKRLLADEARLRAEIP